MVINSKFFLFFSFYGCFVYFVRHDLDTICRAIHVVILALIYELFNRLNPNDWIDNVKRSNNTMQGTNSQTRESGIYAQLLQGRSMQPGYSPAQSNHLKMSVRTFGFSLGLSWVLMNSPWSPWLLNSQSFLRPSSILLIGYILDQRCVILQVFNVFKLQLVIQKSGSLWGFQ